MAEVVAFGQTLKTTVSMMVSCLKPMGVSRCPCLECLHCWLQCCIIRGARNTLLIASKSHQRTFVQNVLKSNVLSRWTEYMKHRKMEIVAYLKFASGSNVTLLCRMHLKCASLLGYHNSIQFTTHQAVGCWAVAGVAKGQRVSERCRWRWWSSAPPISWSTSCHLVVCCKWMRWFLRQTCFQCFSYAAEIFELQAGAFNQLRILFPNLTLECWQSWKLQQLGWNIKDTKRYQ